MTFALILLAILSSGARVTTEIVDIPSMAECHAVAQAITGQIENAGGRVTKAECR